MVVTTRSKGKERALPEDEVPHKIAEVSSANSSSSDSDSDSQSDTSEESDSEEEITQEFLDSLLEKARQNAASSSREKVVAGLLAGEEEMIRLGEDDLEEQPLPPLDPGTLPTPYIELGETRGTLPSKVRDLDVERAEQDSTSALPKAPAPPPSAAQLGKPLTKKQQKALQHKTAGASWFDLPAPAESDLPKLYREVEALRLRNQLDPKRFYRKDEGEGKGIKGLPKYFAIGTIIPDSTPFGTASSDNLSRSQRKRTLVDELVDDAEAKGYAKKKFKELQTVREARGRGTLARKQASRKPKW
ncbi:hypothetical protein PHLCEN_2v12152 [Hermanssonia centrifuga]|uniref:Fcf2 pre-rRNA processing C-terminal domain-containing protein n=1 Tax=Hermanssonia centrifuga TaxID=98765 RepID=A0A2R6NIV6_9APHY|nr:hypothetical protein PHLCEN_2v12152 [Hermanssonia centrifuga]